QLVRRLNKPDLIRYLRRHHTDTTIKHVSSDQQSLPSLVPNTTDKPDKSPPNPNTHSSDNNTDIQFLTLFPIILCLLPIKPLCCLFLLSLFHRIGKRHYLI